MANRFVYGGEYDIGVDREKQEDYLHCVELDGETILCVIADGSGSVEGYPQPASLVVSEIMEDITEMYRDRKDIFLSDPEYFLKKAMLNAGKVLGGFKFGHEETLGQMAASVSCLLISRRNSTNMFWLSHAGNTRIYILRNGKLLQMTRDHTVGAEKLANGEITEELYYTLPDRLKVTSGIGYLWNPEIQTRAGVFRSTDLLIMTSDGIHYALRAKGIASLVLASEDCASAANALIRGAREFHYPDNMAAIVIRDTGIGAYEAS